MSLSNDCSVCRKAFRSILIQLMVGATLIIASAPAAAQAVFVEHFNDNQLDQTLWDEIENGIGVHIDETDQRLEFSTNGSPGQAGIYSRDWAIATDGDFRLTLDFNLTVGNPGSVAVGLNIALYHGGDPGEGTLEDRIDVGYFREGANYYVQWFLFADGAIVDGDLLLASETAGTLYLFYDESADRLWVSTIGFGNHPGAIAIENIVTETAAPDLRVYLGGFMNGLSNPVNGDDAWGDRIRLTEGTFLDFSAPDVQLLDARDDADWFRRGDAAGDRLGWSLAFAGDVDVDGRGDVIAGAPREDTAAPTAGAAFVYSGDDGSLIFSRFGETAGDQFGFSVGAAGDWNNDGVDDVIVGAPRFDTMDHVNAGKAYVYSGVTPHDLLWSATGEATGDNFGYRCAGVGDVNNDGFDDVLVAAPFNDAAGDAAGRVYLYLGGTGLEWTRKTGEAAGDQLGRIVSAAGDVDDDGDPDYLVAAPFNDEGGGSAGKVYVYAGDTNMLIRSLVGRSAGDRLGWAADTAGDIDGDNHDDLLIGAAFDDTTGTNAGATFVYSGNDGSIILELNGEQPDDRFGWSVAGVRDMDGDGVPDLAVGAERSDAGGNNSGQVTIFSGVDGAPLVQIDGERGGNRYGGVVDADRQSASPVISVIGGAWRFNSNDLNRRGSIYRHDFVAP